MLRLGRLEVGWAKLAELREAIRQIQAAGKPVVVYFTAAPGDGTYYLASAADWLVCPPVSLVGLDGLRSEATFYTSAMEKLGVEAEFERVGKYKSAVEPFTRTSLSEPAKQAREAVLDDIFAELVEKIADGRQLAEDRVREIIDGGPYVSSEAREAGLIDQIAYEDELSSIVNEHIGRRLRHVGLSSLLRRKYRRYTWGPAPEVAIVFAEGTMASGVDRRDFVLGEVLGDRTTVAAIRRARNDRDVKAIVLRIDSPGGSGIASDIIWREVKRTVGVKPIVVSMSDVAASGGYYIACPADSIFASAATITGSIGVYYGKVSLAGLYEKTGIDKEVLTRGKNAGMYSANRPFTENERAILRRQVGMFYDNFIKIVAEGRGKTPEEIDRVARGRVWTGKAAYERGLVDKLGGLPDAIRAAAEMADIADRNYEIKIFPRGKRSFSSLFQSPLSLFASGGASLLDNITEFTEDKVWYLLPWRLVVE